MRKLYFITNRFFDALTGGEIYNKALIESAENAGFNVEILERISLKKPFKNLIGANFYYLYKMIFSSKNSVFVFDTDLHARYILAVFGGSIFKKNLVGMLHHYNYPDKKNKFSFMAHRWMEKFVSSRFNRLITNSKFSQNSYEELTNKAIKTDILYPFINVDLDKKVEPKNPIQKDKTVFLHVGSIEKRKNVINVLKALKKSGVTFTYKIAGKPTNDGYFNFVKNLIDELGIKDSVEFLGRIDDLDSLYRECDIFLMVSEHEGYGMAYAESISYGLPVIATNTSAVPEVVEDNFNGLLCNPFCVDDIAKKIQKLATDLDLQKEFSINNINSLEKFNTLKKFKEKAKEVFEGI